MPRSAVNQQEYTDFSTVSSMMELTGEQLKRAEIHVKRYLPQSLNVYSYLVLLNRSPPVRSDPVKVIVDRWPEFNVIVCKPQYEQKGDLFKVTVVFANSEASLEEIIRNSSVIDWTKYLCLGINVRYSDIINAVASEKNVPSNLTAVCHMMILEDISSLPSVDSSGITLSSLNQSHVALVNQMWKFAESEDAIKMIRNIVTSFPSCCVLDAEAKPVSWILTYEYGALGMLYTLPEHRGKGYAKVLVSTMAKRFRAQGYPVYCFVEEGNVVSYGLFKSLGFTEEPSCRSTFSGFNEF